LVFATALTAQTVPPSLRGTITDPSGAIIPGAVVQLRGPGGEQRATTNNDGQYSFLQLAPGTYQVRIVSSGFAIAQRPNVKIDATVTLDAQLSILSGNQTINVEAELGRVSVDPSDNGGAIVLGRQQIDQLSDDPDVLQQQLLALAGPGAGPNGGQIYVDGFSGAQLPSKASIREVRINSNPFSAEFDRVGEGRIEIITQPGTGMIRGNVNGQYNKEALNSRSPLLTQAKRPQYKVQSVGFGLSGPIKKGKSSFTMEGGRRAITENSFILATMLDSNLNPLLVNQTVITPQTNTNISGRIDYAFNKSHNLVVRVGLGKNERDNIGAGDFNLATKAYDASGNSQSLQVTETAVVSMKMVNETRFQLSRSKQFSYGDNTVPSLFVQGAFNGGGAQIGTSGSLSKVYDLTNTTTYTRGTHTFRWGARVKNVRLENTSVNNFGGGFTFQGRIGPELDANNAPTGKTEQLTALEVYRRTLLFQRKGIFDDAALRALGGGAYQFNLAGGIPTTLVGQTDGSAFLTDDWRARYNVTFSYGLRYETQNNISDWANFAPRVAVAWGVDSTRTKQGSTVLRGGVGVFYDRVSENATLNELRFNGITQQSFLVFDPAFFRENTKENIPSLSSLTANKQPQQLQLLYDGIRTPRTYRVSVGGDRAINRALRVSANYSFSRSIHLQRARNINAPISGLFPFGDRQLRMLAEGSGNATTHQIYLTPALNFKQFFVAGFYAMSFGKSDAEGQPADPYNLRAEWSRSSYNDVRHRANIQGIVPLPYGVSVGVAFTAQSGSPYNISIGRDLNGDSINAERPSLVTNVAQSACTGGNLSYRAGFGCFNLSPTPGTSIVRNFATGPSVVNIVGVRLGKNWTFGSKERATGTVTVQGPGGTNIAAPAAIAALAGVGPAQTGASRIYTLNLTLQASNPLNHTTYAAPSGDLSSPYFNVYRSTTNGGTFNRRIDLVLRLNF
jgi:hypothetical protein